MYAFWAAALSASPSARNRLRKNSTAAFTPATVLCAQLLRLELGQRPPQLELQAILDLAHALARQVEVLADLRQRVGLVAQKAARQDVALARGQPARHAADAIAHQRLALQPLELVFLALRVV